MKKFLKIFAVLAVATFAFACSDDDDSTSVTDVTIPSQYLTEGFTFSATGGTATMNLVSKGSLDVTSNQSWCSVTFVSSTSNGTCSYEITVSENSSTDVRTAEITVSAGGKVAGTVKVTQEGADGLLVAQTRYELSAEAQTFTVTVTANGTPEITCNNSWITLESGTKAMESADYVFSVTTNYGSERTGGITFTLGSQTETVTVVQAEGSGGSMASDAKTLISKFYAGVNIGNTMEVPGGETGWGNPRVNKTYVDGLATMGFNAVRIPCAWDSYIINDATYEIDPTWMERVSEVVGYCLDNDMYVIINIHWDGGWLEDNIKQGYNESINAKQKALWTQIADNFVDYDEHLLFAGCNEPGMNESAYSATGVDAIMKYEQTFVDAVRATGGNNASRCLIVQAPGTDIDNAVSTDVPFSVPTDTVSDRMIVEVHYYDPYQFTLMEGDASWGNEFWYWGSSNYVSGSSHNATWGEVDYILEQFGKMKTGFVDKGYPVIIGEYCAIKRTNVDNQEKHNQSRADYNEAVTRYAKEYGCAPFYWETGTDINRTTGAVKEDYAIEGIMKGASEGKYPF